MMCCTLLASVSALAIGISLTPLHAATLALPSLSVGPTGGGTPSVCPDDDGSASATPGAANYPTLISAGNYKTAINLPVASHGLNCKVAGVDDYVGVPPGLALKDPTTAALPAGCKYDGSRYVDCSGTVTISGYDFSLHNTLLTGSGTTTVVNNKFAMGANCIDPMINVTGSLTMTDNTIDGTAGYGCNLNQGFGSFVNENLVANGSFTAERNFFLKIPQDGFDINAPSSGTEIVTIKYNLGHNEGKTGHPDFIQFCGGGAGIIEPIIEHNTWYDYPGDTSTTQPIHVEAQTCGEVGHIKNAAVRFNTVLATGTCNGGTNFPTNCSANFDIACKQDDTSTNVGFEADGNYADWSGAIAALTNGYGCPGTTWGTPYANYDMSAGVALGTKPAAVFAARLSTSLAAKLKAIDVARHALIQKRLALLKTLNTARLARLAAK